jgi:hypothetical protein
VALLLYFEQKKTKLGELEVDLQKINIASVILKYIIKLIDSLVHFIHYDFD